ncbi:MAG: thioredoxin domain-containing protein [Clostridia bacterium]|nr:thioredoxin domain-containing protein [Clostridia bacterium]
MANRLINEASPYLLQHADNPVDWYPWCREAFDKAETEDKPIFLSIGYSTCHWCHVMERESFENKDIADILNRDFVSIKVDREERPDIDSVYMDVCLALNGSGGWPATLFLTSDKKAFFAGTYYPPDMLRAILGRISALWKNDRERLINTADTITNELRRVGSNKKTENNRDPVESAHHSFQKIFDTEYGGFGTAPKFPAAHNLLFLMLYADKTGNSEALKMVEKTLKSLRLGGIYDQIEGGFSRYSTDKYYLVPHFEKMLYDNALLIAAYAAAYNMTGKAMYVDTAKECADFVLREMTSSDGGFYSAQDSDTDGEEGKYYTLGNDEIKAVLGDNDAFAFSRVFDITEEGNFQGKNIPNLIEYGKIPEGFDENCEKIYQYRKDRFSLRTDDKILFSWNSMMIAALSILHRASGEKKYLDAAEKAQTFLFDAMTENDRIFTSYRAGKRSESGFLDDYAYGIAGLVELYGSTFREEYLDLAEKYCDAAADLFYDSENGGFFLSVPGDAELFLNPKETYDGAVPSGNSMMTYDLVRLYQLTKKEKYRTLAERQISFMDREIGNSPIGGTMFLISKMLFDDPPADIVIAKGKGFDISDLRLPILANIRTTEQNKEYPLINDRTTFYVCRDKTCLPPGNDLNDLIG